MTLSEISRSFTDLCQAGVQGVVAVKTGAYRTVSGVVVGEDLVAVTNHTLKRRDQVAFQTQDGAGDKAEVVGRDPRLDLAILRLPQRSIQALPWAESATLRAGSLVAVVGLTTDAGPSVSLGILGAVGKERRTWRGGLLSRFVRLDAALYPSQAGAAVIDADGKLIGMATPALSRHSTIVIPIDTIHSVAQDLISGRPTGRGYLGVGLQPVNLQAAVIDRFKLNQKTGLIVLSIEPDSAAEAARLQIGDVLLSLNKQPTDDVLSLHQLLAQVDLQNDLPIELLRGGELVQATVRLGDRS